MNYTGAGTSAVVSAYGTGNPFFEQFRPEKDEKIFKLFKFKTMSNAKDKAGNLPPDFQSLNTYGRFLRSMSLDELLELLNIVAITMSLVEGRGIIETTKKSVDFSRIVTVNSISL